MKDGTRELTNNQWLLKADADKLPATYAELVTLLTGAGLPFGRTLLSDGWTIEPDPLNKANLLKDATAALFGLGSTAQINDVLAAIKTYINNAAAQGLKDSSFTTAGWANIGGFILQWGTATVATTETTATITFPIAFNTNCLHGFCATTALLAAAWLGVNSVSSTSMVTTCVRQSGSGAIPFRWLAIGH